MSIVDIDLSSGALKKLTIRHEQKLRNAFDGEIVALFNPSQLKYDNRVEWRAAGTVAQSIAAGFQRMEFQATPPATFAVDLFFDTYEGAQPTGVTRVLDVVLPDQLRIGDSVSATDVTRLTTRVANLARVASELHRPPVCRLEWGKTLLFQGVLTQLHQDFTFFLPDGTPVRATLGCSFMAYRTFDVAAKDVELHSADVAKRRVVRRGDTLSGIALEQYGDATRWRDIARDNDIDDPRMIAPGQVLVIPKLVT
jgi:nucleoid-associated protein YgaU